MSTSSVGAIALSLLGLSALLFFGSLLLGLAAVYAIPRLCMIFLRHGVTYPTFGVHYLLQTIILRVSNSQFLCVLFGDSSFITTYMRYVGWNLNKVEPDRLEHGHQPAPRQSVPVQYRLAARWFRTACR